MRTLSGFFDFSLHFISFLFISLIFFLSLLPYTLLPYTFNFLDVLDNIPAHFRWGAGPPGQKELLHRSFVVWVWRERSSDQDDFKGKKSCNETCFQNPQSCSYWWFDRTNLDPKIQIKYIDTKNQLADMLTKGNFTRDEWNHLLCLFNISHFISTECSEVMSKRTQEESGEESVTAKSRPMRVWLQGLPQLCHLRHQKARRREVMKVKVLWVCKLRNMIERWNLLFAVTQVTSRLVESTHSASYSEWDDDIAWSSQGWKSDELMDDRTEKPVFLPSMRSTPIRHWRRRNRIKFDR